MSAVSIVRKRIKALKNVRKITKSMKMVSATRFARSERDLDYIRPYGEAAVKFYKKANISAPENIPGKEKLYIAIASDKGLCGAVHVNICRYIRDFLTTDPDSKLICFGDKSRFFTYLNFSKNIMMVATEIGKKPTTFKDVSKLTNAVLNSEYQPFNDGKILFSKSRNSGSYSSKYLPIVGTGVLKQASKFALYNECDNDVIQSYLEYSLASLLYYAVKENIVAELSARMNAMEAATKNAGDLIDDLTVTYNRSRQSVVTREISEIVSTLM